MITDIVLTLNDFQFNFNKLRSLYNKEPDVVKKQFELNNRVDWIKFQQYVRSNETRYFDFIMDFMSYEIFPSNLLVDLKTGKKSYNQTILLYYNNYMRYVQINEKIAGTSLYILIHALVNNPSRYCLEKSIIIMKSIFIKDC